MGWGWGGGEFSQKHLLFLAPTSAELSHLPLLLSLIRSLLPLCRGHIDPALITPIAAAAAETFFRGNARATTKRWRDREGERYSGVESVMELRSGIDAIHDGRTVTTRSSYSERRGQIRGRGSGRATSCSASHDPSDGIHMTALGAID